MTKVCIYHFNMHSHKMRFIDKKRLLTEKENSTFLSNDIINKKLNKKGCSEQYFPEQPQLCVLGY